MKKKLTALILTLCLILCVVGCGSSDEGGKSNKSLKEIFSVGLDKPEKNAFTPNKTETFQGYSFFLPEYMGDKAPNSYDSTNYYYAEQGGKVAMLMVQISDATGVKESEIKNYTASYMMCIQSSLQEYKSIETEYVTIADHKGYKEYFTCSLSGLKCNAVIYMFLDEANQKVVSFFWGETDNSDYTYFKDVEKIIESVQ